MTGAAPLSDGDVDAALPGATIGKTAIVGGDVVIHAGATIHGRVTIGANSTINGNVWLLNNVPAGSVVAQPKASVLPQERGLALGAFLLGRGH